MSIRIKGTILFTVITLSIIVVCISLTTKPTLAENTTSEAVKTQYILSEFNGKLAIFQTNNNIPLEVLDVRIDSLPERDIEKIKNGITANTLNEIFALAEDYE